ncbi:MAG: hypothetical protein PUK49_04535, partial [Oscillospiraceae bacterium]|nr:hypothetical protein [Oscillospiraceae bacterium]
NVCSTTEKARRSFASEHFFGCWVQGFLAFQPKILAPCRPSAAAKADVNQGVRYKSLICTAENPVLQDFQPITALRAVIEYVLNIVS